MKLCLSFGGDLPAYKLAMAQQMGVKYAMASLPFGAPYLNGQRPWDYEPMMRMQQHFRDNGLEILVIESAPPMEKVRLGLPGAEEEIDWFCQMVENMGRLGIPVVCYNWMAQIGWYRTSTTTPGRGGALVTRFTLADIAGAPPAPHAPVSHELLWGTLEHFLKRVVPVAERWNVKLAMHPDDPPIPELRGIGRIMSSMAGYRRLLELVPSPVNGITLCQGNFAAMGADIPQVIREFKDRLHFAHFRDIRGTAEDFVETFHEEGMTDMAAAMRAYAEIGYDGPVRPDHVPTLAGEDNSSPSYGVLGNLYAVGYMKGLAEAVQPGFLE